MKKDNNFIYLIKDDNITFEFDIEFPFSANLSDNNNNEVFNLSLNNEYEVQIPLSPDNTDYTCIPKAYYKNDHYFCFTHFDYNNKKARCKCKTKLNDEILIINDKEISNEFKKKQFEKLTYKIFNNYDKIFIYSFIILFLILSIYYLSIDIMKDSKIINNRKLIEDFEDDPKEEYKEIKKYYNTGVCSFSFYLTLRRFPLFTVFNKYNTRYPRYLKHFIIFTGLLFGFITSLIPFYFIEFSERDIFINQRSIDYDDSVINYILPNKYYLISMIFSLFGIIFGNLFIYIFSKIFNFRQDEINKWLDIKTLCKDYIYYKVKSEVLLESCWNKIKLRILAYYFICGQYILEHEKKNNKFKDYLKHISRNYEVKNKNTIMSDLKEIDVILPRGTRFNNSLDINNVNLDNNRKSKNKNIEMKERNNDESNIIDVDEKDLLLGDNIINNPYNNKDNKINIFNNNSNLNCQNVNLKICKLDNFILDKNTKFSKNKRKIERFEKIRNKYIYIRKKIDIEEIDIDDNNSQKKKLDISPQMSYSFYPYNSFNSLGKYKNGNSETNKYILIFLFSSLLLFIIFIGFGLAILNVIKNLLNKFDYSFFRLWIIIIILAFLILNFILYYIKTFIEVFILFHFYHLRKRNCFCKCIFLFFIDKAMIHAYKVRNLINKYKKEFDYL